MGGTGAGSSNEENKGGQDQKTKDAAKGLTKVCYYERLGVEKDASEKEIKNGFRKMSLKLHPDKNPDRDTTEEFQEVNEAYQCLSDNQSRAWYDKHRDQILKGKDPDNMKEGDESYMTPSNLKPFFKDSCHGGMFPTAENNFYTVYDELFRKLDKEEELEEEVGKHHYEAPAFGLHYACAEDVFAFYDNWKCFSTCKSMAYADLYNPNEAPNRRVKRIIETENKKERQREQKRFNEMVRELIEKLMEKDPRYKKFVLQREQEKAEKKRKIEEAKAAQRAEKEEELRLYREERAR